MLAEKLCAIRRRRRGAVFDANRHKPVATEAGRITRGVPESLPRAPYTDEFSLVERQADCGWRGKSLREPKPTRSREAAEKDALSRGGDGAVRSLPPVTASPGVIALLLPPAEWRKVEKLSP
jgi:hypothetical protein